MRADTRFRKLTEVKQARFLAFARLGEFLQDVLRDLTVIDWLSAVVIVINLWPLDAILLDLCHDPHVARQFFLLANPKELVGANAPGLPYVSERKSLHEERATILLTLGVNYHDWER